jgi:hypothetical protein
MAGMGRRIPEMTIICVCVCVCVCMCGWVGGCVCVLEHSGQPWGSTLNHQQIPIYQTFWHHSKVGEVSPEVPMGTAGTMFLQSWGNMRHSF